MLRAQSDDAEIVQVRRLMQSSSRQLLIIDTDVPLRRGRRYRIAFSEYRGVIGDDLRGLYRSTYRDQQGRQRYVVEWLTVCDGRGTSCEIAYCDGMGTGTNGIFTGITICRFMSYNISTQTYLHILTSYCRVFPETSSSEVLGPPDYANGTDVLGAG